MGKITGFLEIDRFERRYAPAAERIRNYKEFTLPIPEEALRQQGARCMDCGIPYCHNGCPVNNQIPDWNDLVYRGDWEEASRNLHSTNNFPEFTGRICPAPCEAACTLNINDASVTIKTIECSIVDRAWAEGWIKPERFGKDTGKMVAVIGSGPAGMACAQQLARAGHAVHLYEKQGKPGGLLRYGIPDFKMEKHLIDRRVAQMEAEGVVFHCGVNVGVDITGEELKGKYDAVVLSGGSEKPRDLRFPAASCTASISPWTSCRSRTAASATRSCSPTTPSSPPASTSSSSAAATLAPTASAPRSARVRSRSPSSKSCPSRRSRKTRC